MGRKEVKGVSEDWSVGVDSKTNLENTFANISPDSCSTVYYAATQALDRLTDDLLVFEQAYYGSANVDAATFINDAMDHLRCLACTAASQVNNGIRETGDNLAGGFILKSNSKVEELCFEAASAGTKAIAIANSLDTVRKLNTHMRQYACQRLTPILRQFTQAVEFVQKYCQSFWNLCSEIILHIPVFETKRALDSSVKDCDSPSTDNKRKEKPHEKNLLETLHNYEQFRVKTVQSINQHFLEIREQILSFLSGGIELNQFGEKIQALADQTKARAAPILFLFPNAMNILRSVCEQLREWIRADKDYLIQINDDLAGIQKQRHGALLRQRKAFERMTHWRFQQTRVVNEITQLNTLLTQMSDRRTQAQNEFALAELEVDKLELLAHSIQIRSEQLQHDYEMQQVEKANELEAARHAEAKHNWLRVKITMRTKMIVDQFRTELKHPQRESPNERLVHNKRIKSRHTDELKNQSKEDESRQTDKKYSTRLSNAEIKHGKPVNRVRVEFRSRPISVNPAEIVECKQRLLQLNQKRIPVANRKKTEAKMRLQWFHQKSAQLSQLCERQKQYQLRQIKAESKFNFFQTILQTIDKASVVLNHVRSLKANPMTIRKLANNMELKTFQMSSRNLAESDRIHKQEVAQGKTKSEKKLDAIIKYVAKHIGQDWRNLFYKLPFNPMRGLIEKEEMLAQLNKRLSRADHPVLALHALSLWRQSNFNATAYVVCDTLEEINRGSIAKQIRNKYRLTGSKKTLSEIHLLQDIVEGLGVERTNQRPPQSALTRAIQQWITTPRSENHSPDHSCMEQTYGLRQNAGPDWIGLPVALTVLRTNINRCCPVR